MANFNHELAKEPNRNVLFETVFKFIAKRISDRDDLVKHLVTLIPKLKLTLQSS